MGTIECNYITREMILKGTFECVRNLLVGIP